MSRLIWTPPALADIQRIFRFLAARNPQAASRAVKAVRTGVKILAERPLLGRRIEDMDVEMREWLIDFGESGYVVLYRFDGQMVSILAVRHQREAGY